MYTRIFANIYVYIYVYILHWVLLHSEPLVAKTHGACVTAAHKAPLLNPTLSNSGKPLKNGRKYIAPAPLGLRKLKNADRLGPTGVTVLEENQKPRILDNHGHIARENFRPSEHLRKLRNSSRPRPLASRSLEKTLKT